MKIKLVGIVLFMLFSAVVYAQPSSLVDCPRDDIYLAKEGGYGAVSPEVFSGMTQALEKHDVKVLGRMLKDKVIVKLNAGDKACLILATDWYRKQVWINESGIPYWVSDEDLIKVE
jgi:hypothetical protein